MNPLLERLRGFQGYLHELGVARSVLALPAPRMLSLPAPSSGENEPENLFGLFVTEPEIVDVARDLFVSGFHNQAVCEAMKALDKKVQKISKISGKSGTSLMTQVFSEVSPILSWSSRETQSEKDEHNGYQRLFAGAMLGIRNPCTHEHQWVDDPETALECIVLCQHLLRKAKAAIEVVKA
jgi:uncharacterized protein (TIGR02391 family)